MRLPLANVRSSIAQEQGVCRRASGPPLGALKFVIGNYVTQFTYFGLCMSHLEYLEKEILFAGHVTA